MILVSVVMMLAERSTYAALGVKTERIHPV